MKRFLFGSALTSSLFLVPAMFAQESPSPADTPLTDTDKAVGLLGAGCGCVGTIIYLAVILLIILGLWKMFTKAGKPGWAAIVPIYNMIVLCEIVGRPAWWVVLMLIPFVNVIAAIIILIDLAKAFGKTAGYGIGMVILPFIFIPMLGFGSATYRGPVAASTTTP
jgi:hypothetical protein